MRYTSFILSKPVCLHFSVSLVHTPLLLLGNGSIVVMLFNIVPKSRLTESSAFICCIMLSQLCSGGQKYDAIAFLANMCFVLFVSSFKVPAVF